MRFKKVYKYLTVLIAIISIMSMNLPQSFVMAEDGSNLWLRYVQVADSSKLTEYRNAVTEIVVQNYSSSTTLTAIRDELNMGLDGLLAQDVPYSDTAVTRNGSVVAGTPASSAIINGLGLGGTLDALGDEGFVIKSAMVNGYNVTVIASKGNIGALYGTFNFLKLIQTEKSLSSLNISEKPKIKIRQLDHWETVRCYAGGNIWNWSVLPGTVDPKYKIYARANAAVGINAVVLNCVNADKNFLNATYISKEKALADLFRPYGIKVYLSANFAAPQTLGGLSTADPLNTQVIQWWVTKCNEIYAQIPDFGGFLVKANSEGEPGPKDYGRTHADGANCLANGLASHGGVVLWRAFVYDAAIDTDRLKRAYKDFTPLDGQFSGNVFVQVKNGPLDFQPREPFNPLFGKMPNTPLAMEFQITQEYTGQGIQLVFLAPMWEEVLKTDTYANGAGSTVGKVIDGTVHNYSITCMAGVANTGSDLNWTGQIFGQANWFAFGRLAWNHELTSDSIADDWTRMTWGNNTTVVGTIKAMLMGSWEACVSYMTPLGLGHIMKADNHYGPDPGYTYPGHEDWSPTYFHKADSSGLGYNRSSTGSNLVGQYFSTVGNQYNNISTCPENLLCWFHHVPWTRTMQSGRTFWNELCYRYQNGVQYVTNMKAQWNTLNGLVDSTRFSHVQGKLSTHETDAKTWRDTCINYFKGFSGQPTPSYNPGPTPTPGNSATPTPTPTPGNTATPTPTPTAPPTGSGAWLESGGKVCIEAERVTEYSAYAYMTDRSSHTWNTVVAGSSGNAMQCTPDNGSYWTDTATLNSNAPEMILRIKFATAGNYNVWLLYKAANGTQDSIHVGLDDSFKHTKDFSENNTWKWEKTGTISGITSGYHGFDLWAREDGLMVDKIYLTTGTDTPSGTGPAESARE